MPIHINQAYYFLNMVNSNLEETELKSHFTLQNIYGIIYTDVIRLVNQQLSIIYNILCTRQVLLDYEKSQHCFSQSILLFLLYPRFII